MVKVPEYQRNVSLRPELQQDINVRASAEAFGASAGRGLGQFAQGVANLGASISEVQQLEDVTRAKEADNNYANWLRERQYGENGFMTLEGKNAVDGRKTFEDEAEQKRAEFGKGLGPGAAKAYQNASQARYQSTLQQSIVHSANARKTWFKEASTARLDTFAEDALASFQNPALVQKNIAAGQAELRQRGQMEGWDKDKLDNTEKEYVSGVYKNIALRMAQDDPVAAQKYAKEKKDSLTGPHQADLDGVFQPLVVQEKAKRYTDEFLTKSAKVPSNKFAATDLPQPAYGLLGVIAGTESPDYRTINGGTKFDSYDDHPRVKGAGGSSTAAGRYQFVKGTWDRVAGAIGAADFSPANQDKGAWWLAQADYKRNTGRDLTTDLNAGNYSDVRRGLASTWEGLHKLSDAQFASRMQSASGTPASADPTAFLDGISNPAVREATVQRIKAIQAVREQQSKADALALKTQAFSFVDKGQTPDAIPADLRAQIGREEMAGLWSYYEARIKSGQPKTDEKTLYDLQTMYAQDPSGFGGVDLFRYRDRLSDEDWKSVNSWRQTALTDERKAKDEGMSITTAFKQAESQLEAVGITKEGKKGDAVQAEAARIAQFQMALTAQMNEFKVENKKSPNQIEIQSMINRLLLPIVIKEPGKLWGTNEKKGFAFESALRSDNSTVDVAVEYKDIPIDLRRGISVDLERELGRKPSEEEIVQRYEQVALSQ